MSKNKLQKIEEVSLSLFKVIVIALMSITLIAILGLLLKGAFDYTEKPKEPPAREKATEKRDPPPISVDPERFLNEFLPKQKPAETVDPLDKLVEKYLELLWVHFEKYQQQCDLKTKTTKETFVSTFPKQYLKNWFRQWGEPFAISQDKVVQIILGNEKIIAYCKDQQGKGGAFIKTLNWHKEEWEDLAKARDQFIVSEDRRIKSFELEQDRKIAKFISEEINRIQEQKENALRLFWSALFGYGIFISLAILLLLARIAHNWLVRKEVSEITTTAG